MPTPGTSVLVVGIGPYFSPIIAYSEANFIASLVAVMFTFLL